MTTAQAEFALGEVDAADLLAHGDFAAPRAKWASTLAELIDVLASDAVRNGAEPVAALDAARHTVLVIAEHFGGRPVYLPRGDALRDALRDRAIYLLHNGTNVDELADRFGLTVRSVQRVYTQQRSIQVRKRQARLFSDG